MPDLAFTAHDSYPPEETVIVDTGLGDSNDAAAPLHEVQAISCFARTESGQVIGGAVGRRWGKCCELQQLWVMPSHRRRGIGAQLVKQFEAHALKQGCNSFCLETFSFQAPALYRSLGYAVEYERTGYPHGITKFHMAKPACHSGPVGSNARALSKELTLAGQGPCRRRPLSSNGRRHERTGRLRMLYLRATAVWLLILLFAMLNGGFRESVLFPRLGNPAAQFISGVLLIGCILALSYLLVPRIGVRSQRELMSIGASWFALTLMFEFGFGLVVEGKSWQELLAAYTFHDGNIWPVIMLVTLLAPYLVGCRNLPRS